MLQPEEIVDLSDFLRRDGFKPSLHQVFAAQRIISQLQPQSASGLVNLSTLLSPVFCTTPQEQEKFNELYLQWLLQRSDRPSTIPPPIEPKKPPGNPPRSHWRMKLAFASLLIITVIPSWFGWQDFRERIVIGRVIAEGISVEKVTAIFGEQPVSLELDGQFTIPFQAKEMPSVLAVEANGFIPHSVEVGQDIKSNRNWLYLYPLDWSKQLYVPDVILKKDTPLALPTPLPPPSPPEPRVLPKPEPPKIEEPEISLSPEPIAVLRTPPPLWWDRLQLDKAGMALLPLFAALLWTLIRMLRRPVLKRLSNNIPPALKAIQVQAGLQQVFPSLSLRHITQRLRQARFVHSAKLDLARTIKQTVERAGLFTPVYGSKQEPGYVALIDRSTIGDHHANLATQLVSDLDRGYVLIRQYEFDEHATILRPVVPGKNRSPRDFGQTRSTTGVDMVMLEEVQAKFPTNRLLYFAEATTCFDPLTGELYSWVEPLEAWEERFFFNTKISGQWGQAERILAKRGFRVIPLSSLGLRLFSTLIEQGNATLTHRAAGLATTPLSERMPERWLERHAPSPEIVKRLLNELHQDLGDDGMRWLAACAAYPEIHWGLTLEWGVRLFGYGARAESLLPKLTPLIWFRQAFMPDWFRIALYDRLSAKEADQISQGLAEILSAVNPETAAGLQLHIAIKPDKTIELQKSISWLKAWYQKVRQRSQLQEMGNAVEPGHPMRDYVMLQYLSGGQGKALSPLAPRALLSLLFPKGQPWLGFRPVLVLGMALMLSAGCWWWFAPDAVPVLAPIQATTISSDGTRIAAGREDGRLQVWDQATSQLVLDQSGKEVSVTSLSMAYDGLVVAVGYQDGSVQVWDIEKKEKLVVAEHETPVITTGVKSTIDGSYQILSIGSDGNAMLTDGKDENTKELGLLSVSAMAISQNEEWAVAANNEGTAWIASFRDQDFQSFLDLNDSFTLLNVPVIAEFNLALDPTGQFLMFHDFNGMVKIWNKEKEEQIAQMTVPMGVAPSLSWPTAQEALLVSSGSNGPEVRGIKIPEEFFLQRLTTKKVLANAAETVAQRNKKEQEGKRQEEPKVTKKDPGVKLLLSERRTIQRSGQKDVYIVTIQTKGQYKFETTGNTDVMITVLGPSKYGRPILAADTDSGEGFNAKLVLSLDSDTYFVEVTSESNDELGEYEVTVQGPNKVKGQQIEAFLTRISGNDGAPMVLVPAGEFTMGARDDDKEAPVYTKPAHQIYLDSFYIDQFEVTTTLYDKFLQETKRKSPRSQTSTLDKRFQAGKKKPPEFWSETIPKKHGQKPVIGVTWDDANDYCQYYEKGLPTEAEWEKAARGTDSRRYPWGNQLRTQDFANFGKSFNFNIVDVYDEMLENVGTLKQGKSPYGAYDMAGNVWEWVEDWYDENLYQKRTSLKGEPSRNSRGSDEGEYKVLRGGSWNSPAKAMPSTFRIKSLPSDRMYGTGFRCAGDAKNLASLDNNPQQPPPSQMDETRNPGKVPKQGQESTTTPKAEEEDLKRQLAESKRNIRDMKNELSRISKLSDSERFVPNSRSANDQISRLKKIIIFQEKKAQELSTRLKSLKRQALVEQESSTSQTEVKESPAPLRQPTDFLAGIVRIRTENSDRGKAEQGSGVIIQVDSEGVFVLTAANLVEWDSRPDVRFFPTEAQSFEAEVLPKSELKDPSGLALLRVPMSKPLLGNILSLPLAGDQLGFVPGERVFLLGVSQVLNDWEVLSGRLTPRSKQVFMVDVRTDDEGFTGGAIIQKGQVVGVVLGLIDRARVSSIHTIREFLDWMLPRSSSKNFPRVDGRPSRITGQDGAPMVLVPAGEFTMGAREDDKQANEDERPAHRVYLDAYYIDQYEATTSRYAMFFAETKRDPPRFWAETVLTQHSNKPVVGVTWEDAQAYCVWTGKRLPTEAEWEKAARGTDARLYPWGNDPPNQKIANFNQSVDFKDYGALTDVGSFEGNISPYGVYDMAGNVWEWVADWYDENYYQEKVRDNPKGAPTGQYRVLRGGSWDNRARNLRSHTRYRINPTIAINDFGFRCAQGIPLSRKMNIFNEDIATEEVQLPAKKKAKHEDKTEQRVTKGQLLQQQVGEDQAAAKKAAEAKSVAKSQSAQTVPVSKKGAPRDLSNIIGSKECGECHKSEVFTWKDTHHFTTFNLLPRKKNTKVISKKMGIRSVKRDSDCLTCHFTSKIVDGKEKVISGISCESCHGPAAKWVKIHGDYGGKKVTKEMETPEHKADRLAKIEAAKMIRPKNLYRVAENCYQCHTVPNEKLVNVGGHKAGSDFELVAWSQGEVRHNFFNSSNKENRQASSARKQLMFIVGSAVHLEYSLRGVAKSTQKALYAVKMAKRVVKIKKDLTAIQKVVNIPEIKNMLSIANSVKLKLNNEAALVVAAENVAKEAKIIAKTYSGQEWKELDKLIPKKFKGKVPKAPSPGR